MERRNYLAAVATCGATALAGCQHGDGGDGNGIVDTTVEGEGIFTFTATAGQTITVDVDNRANGATNINLWNKSSGQQRIKNVRTQRTFTFDVETTGTFELHVAGNEADITVTVK